MLKKREKTNLKLEIEDRGHWIRGERRRRERREKGTRYSMIYHPLKIVDQHVAARISNSRSRADLSGKPTQDQPRPARLTCLSPLAPWMPIALRALFPPGSNTVTITGQGALVLQANHWLTVSTMASNWHCAALVHGKYIWNIRNHFSWLSTTVLHSLTKRVVISTSSLKRYRLNLPL